MRRLFLYGFIENIKFRQLHHPKYKERKKMKKSKASNHGNPIAMAGVKRHHT